MVGRQHPDQHRWHTAAAGLPVHLVEWRASQRRGVLQSSLRPQRRGLLQSSLPGQVDYHVTFVTFVTELASTYSQPAQPMHQALGS